MDGSTDTAAGLEASRSIFRQSLGDRSDVKNVGLLISDGHSDNRQRTQSEAERNRGAGINMLSVGVGLRTKYDRKEMLGVVTHPDNFLELENMSNIGNATAVIIEAVCNNINECDLSPCEGRGVCTDLINDFECRCPDGRTGRNCERRCDGELDLALVVDTSGSIRRSRWPLVLQFLIDIVDNLEISQQKTRVGLITYADDAILRFTLDAFTNRADLKQAINRLPYTAGKTNTASGLRMLAEELFIRGRGDRDDVDNVAIIISDGHSTINEDDTIPAAIEAKVNGIHLAVATMENDPENLELKGIASDPDEENIFNVKRYSLLPDLIDNIIDITCDGKYFKFIECILFFLLFN